MDDPLALAVLSSACAVAEGALTEREPHPAVFAGLLHLITRLSTGPAVLTVLVEWELVLLRELGYGLDLSSCALTGETEALTWVSPRSGRAVSEAAAAPWKERLLPLPAFLTGGEATPAAWSAGLALTAHFLARDAFGTQHRPLPAARLRLADRVASLVLDVNTTHRPLGETPLDGGVPIWTADTEFSRRSDWRVVCRTLWNKSYQSKNARKSGLNLNLGETYGKTEEMGVEGSRDIGIRTTTPRIVTKHFDPS